MLKLNILQEMLITSIVISVFTCIFIQKTKKYFKNSDILLFYNLVVNMLFSIFFCISFTTIKFPDSLWVGLFSFLGADNIYKTLEGKLATYGDLTRNNKKIQN